jgi:ADP-heptose:LPS heptosyltransferase
MAPKKILAIKLRSLGDTVLMTAPLLELKRAYPEAQIDALVVDTWAPLLENLPGIKNVWKYKRHIKRILRAHEISRLALNLRKEKYDLVVNFHASTSSATLALATGAHVRAVHYHGHKDQDRHSTVEIPGKGILKPIIERDMDTIRALGIHIPAGRLPQLNLQSSELDQARQLLDQLGLKQPVLGLNLGASRSTKSWPLERYVSLAIDWCETQKGSVLAIAGPEETHLIHSFLKALDDLLLPTLPETKKRSEIRSQIKAINHLELRPLAALLSQVKVVAGNDSGPKHLAVAVNTPTVTLFGPENPFEWHPYSPDKHAFLFVEDLKCRVNGEPNMPHWCGIQVCVTEEHKCMRLIGVDQVLSECQRVSEL